MRVCLRACTFMHMQDLCAFSEMCYTKRQRNFLICMKMTWIYYEQCIVEWCKNSRVFAYSVVVVVFI